MVLLVVTALAGGAGQNSALGTACAGTAGAEADTKGQGAGPATNGTNAAVAVGITLLCKAGATVGALAAAGGPL